MLGSSQFLSLNDDQGAVLDGGPEVIEMVRLRPAELFTREGPGSFFLPVMGH